jgi:hypothetical protein
VPTLRPFLRHKFLIPMSESARDFVQSLSHPENAGSNEFQQHRFSGRNSDDNCAQPASALQDRASAPQNAVLAFTNKQSRNKGVQRPQSCGLQVIRLCKRSPKKCTAADIKRGRSIGENLRGFALCRGNTAKTDFLDLQKADAIAGRMPIGFARISAPPEHAEGAGGGLGRPGDRNTHGPEYSIIFKSLGGAQKRTRTSTPCSAST